MNKVIEKAKKEAEERTKKLEKELQLNERGVAISWSKVYEKDRR